MRWLHIPPTEAKSFQCRRGVWAWSLHGSRPGGLPRDRADRSNVMIKHVRSLGFAYVQSHGFTHFLGGNTGSSRRQRENGLYLYEKQCIRMPISEWSYVIAVILPRPSLIQPTGYFHGIRCRIHGSLPWQIMIGHDCESRQRFPLFFPPFPSQKLSLEYSKGIGRYPADFTHSPIWNDFIIDRWFRRKWEQRIPQLLWWYSCHHCIIQLH